MSVDKETGYFRFEGLSEGGYIDLPLVNAEREMLRPLAGEGQPIWKIQQGLLDYAGVLKDNLASLDLGDPEDLKKARALSTEIKAIRWQFEMWERLLGDPTVQSSGGE